MSAEIADVVYTPAYFMEMARKGTILLSRAVLQGFSGPWLDGKIDYVEKLVQIFSSGSPQEHTSTEGYKLERLLGTIRHELDYLRAQEVADSLQSGQEERLSRIREYLE